MNNVREKIMQITNKSNDNFVIDFYADWCGPCKLIDTIIGNVKDDYKNVHFKKLNVDDESELASTFGIRSIPTLLFVKNNEVVKMSIGVINENTLRATINNLLSH